MDPIIEEKNKFFNFEKIIKFLTSRTFIINLLLIIVFFTLVLFGVMQWLKSYTNHGQKILLPSYVDKNISESMNDAQSKTFQMIINDSAHIVGKPGGIILTQNPKGGSYVKENRKVYVSISKFQADVISLTNLPRMYGENYEMKSSELRSLQIKPRIKGYKFDNLGSSNTVLEVWYNNKKIIDNRGKLMDVDIEKGNYLDFVLSSPEGGSHLVPNLVGKPLDVARMITQPLQFQLLVVGGYNLSEAEKGKAMVIEQYPEYDGIESLATGATINVTISANQ